MDTKQSPFIPAVSKRALESILAFVDTHTSDNLQYIINNEQIPKELAVADAQLQDMSLDLVVSVLNDLIRYLFFI